MYFGSSLFHLFVFLSLRLIRQFYFINQVLPERKREILTISDCINKSCQTTGLVSMLEAINGMECCAQFWAPQYERDWEILECAQQRAKKMRGHEERLRNLDLFYLEKRRRGGECYPGIQMSEGR